MTSSGITVTTDELIQLRSRSKVLTNKAKKHIHSSNAGGYLSSFKGRGMEFDEVRIYEQGDDIRHIDWRVTARTGKTHSKLFREERERPILLIVDQSQSMAFGTRVAFKSVIAAKAATLLAWAAIDKGDRVGALIFNDHQHTELRPTSGKKAVLRFIKTLTHYNPDIAHAPTIQPATSWVDTLAKAQRICKPGTLIFILSDFRSPDESAQKNLSLLRRHNSIVNIFIYDALEETPPPAGIYPITNGIQRCHLDTGNKVTRQRYTDQFRYRQNFLDELKNKGVAKFFKLATHENIEQTLSSGLAQAR
ncbi:hypothetical protein PA3071 [hydrothermal vent metagenome]|uniref:DUF58 domain-containing protein n=1 Tax=hydrothermal vent metagenome TaxID=652676 RepID=A0A3B0Z3Y8_9ZZZZ